MVSFTDLLAQGGFEVSATREGGLATRVHTESAVDQLLRLKDPFLGADAN